MGSKNLTSVGFRKFLGALGLGLPAAVAAHFLTFGDGHTLGGATHLAFIDGMIVALCASVLALCSAAIYFAAGTREGSVVAARLEGLIPSGFTLALMAVGWFGLIERAETPHAVPSVPAALAVLCVALLLRFFLCSALRLLAAAALRFIASEFRPRGLDQFELRAPAAPPYKRPQLALSRYSRPPPRFA